MDVDDEYSNVQAIMSLHDPAAGRIVVHPTPAVGGRLTLAHDLMGALGKSATARNAGRGVTEIWLQAAAWICGSGISEIVVLRAHLLPRPALARLVQLAADTGAALILVWHERPPADWRQVLPAATLAVLEDAQEAFVKARDRFRSRPAPAEAVPLYCSPQLPADAGPALAHALQAPLPALPAAPLAGFRAQLSRFLGPDEFTQADLLYAAAMDAVCGFLTGSQWYDRDHVRPSVWHSGAPPSHHPAGGGDPVRRQPDADSVAEAVNAQEGKAESGSEAGSCPEPPGEREGHAEPDSVVQGQGCQEAFAAAADETDHAWGADDDADRFEDRRGHGGLAVFPMPWPDSNALDEFLLALLSISSSPAHSLVLLRGAQAGFLLHGLLLTVPADPGRLGGPGFGGLPLSVQVAEQIRASTLDPLRAAALALTLATGLDPADLGSSRAQDLADDASSIVLGPYPWRSTSTVLRFPVPPHARDLLAAARAYTVLSGGGPAEPLLSAGLGYYEQEVWATAAACGLGFRRSHRWGSPLGERAERPDYWHLHLRCVWVAAPLHDNLHGSPGRQVGTYAPPA
ncbi:hypothetical protein ETD83_12705 [Actinomadura soli]|uniref:Uncharacterized protein n=1 Tax=Actinomadura soli TaxID=2508997 RepID=A0A5C4JDQ1_9ACTN|nr:hypothetical protein ETD83_12705 [Actinomadura soli]